MKLNTICTLTIVAALGVFSMGFTDYAGAMGSWELQGSMMQLLLGIDFVTHESGWACGAQDGLGPVIIHSGDGGTNWETQTSAMLTFFYLDIDMVDELYGYAGGLATFGLIGPGAKTTNGGATWTDIGIPYGLAQAWQDCFAYDRNNVWLTGMWTEMVKDKYGVARTRDAGKTWKRIEATNIGTYSRYSHFVDQNEGWMTAGDWPESTSVANFDVYKRFEHDPCPIELPAGSPLIGKSRANTYRGVIAHTTNGGDSWEVQVDTDQFYFNHVYFLDRLHGWAVGERDYTGYIVNTTDGGKNWNLQYYAPNHGLMDIIMFDSKRGSAIGFGPGVFNPKTRILMTEDGGETWVLDPIDQPYGAMTGTFPDASEGWCIGANNFNMSGLCHYTDPGAIPVSIELYNTPTQGHPGSSISWTIKLKNNSSKAQTVDVWLSISSSVLPPQHNPYVKVLVEDVKLPPNFYGGNTVKLDIPSNAPKGTYTIDNIVGAYPSTSYDSESFNVQVN